jgi:hypothetical protein
MYVWFSNVSGFQTSGFQLLTVPDYSKTGQKFVWNLNGSDSKGFSIRIHILSTNLLPLFEIKLAFLIKNFNLKYFRTLLMQHLSSIHTAEESSICDVCKKVGSTLIVQLFGSAQNCLTSNKFYIRTNKKSV